MEKVFIWTGFICLMLLTLVVTYIVVIAILDVAVKRTQFLNKLSKRFAKWHQSFPKRDHHHRYAYSVYDYEKGEFIHSAYLDESMMTDSEREKQWTDWRKEHARKRETNLG